MSDIQYKEITFTVNGKERSVMIDVRSSLLEVLRNKLHLHSVKKGCEVGECGACTVLIDGEPFDSCIYLAVWAEGKDILTVEGLMGADGSISDIQQAFIDEAAVQCGFCTPGLIMTSYSILADGKRYTRDELRQKLAGNMCRCTGYHNIINAVENIMLKRIEEAEVKDS
ncbi:MAG: (2Fe-2S)-binding protein [Eubacteriales bacterium]|nr:(2Fe-2S)-binding protein [Eubacteriales bacterium]MDD4541478.1 (2Fe-2S)-binding protein [Eubacteriales bacterium]